MTLHQLKGTTALAVMRTSPLHLGHVRLITEMCAMCENVIVLEGSPFSDPTKRDIKNMWLTEERILMKRKVFGDRLLLGTITDIGGRSAEAWGNHVLAECERQFPGLTPTHYFSGAEDDAMWLSAHFQLVGHNIPESFKRNLKGIPKGKLIIMNRLERPISGTAVRTFLIHDDDRWREMTPAINHDIIYAGYEQWAVIWDELSKKKVAP